LGENPTEEEALFGFEAAMAIDNNGEVDFDSLLIFSQSFKTTRAYCVLLMLFEANNDLFLDVMSQFTADDTKEKIYFDYGPIYTSQGNLDTTSEARTSPPNSNGVIKITFNNASNSANTNTLTIASTLLHEGIHAELFRIVAGENNVPEPLSQYHYNIIVDLLEWYENNGPSNFVDGNSQHNFMIYNYVTPIAEAVRELDNNLYPLDNYMAFGWSGLYEMGKLTVPQAVTQSQQSQYAQLALIPKTDSHEHECEN